MAGCGQQGGSTSFTGVSAPPAPPSGSFARTTRDLLKGSQVDAAALPGAGGTVRVALTPSRSVTVELDAPSQNSDGSRSWSGHVVGEPLSSVVLVELNGVVTGFVTCAAGSYELHWLGQGQLEVRASEGRPHCGGAAHPPANARPGVRPKEGATASENRVNVYVVYNQGVLTNLGSANAVQAQAQAFVSQANTCYTNSQVDVQLNLVGTEQVTYTQASTSSVQTSDLDALASGSAFASIRAKRNTVGADLVVLLLDLQPTVGQSFTSGIGFTPDKASGLTPDAGYSVVSLDGFANFTFAHEVGHNFGCQHDAAQNPPSPSQALYPFAFGQRRVGSWATVMAYPQGAEINIPNFSNPAINFQGNPTGVAGVTDNHQAMNLSAPTVATWAPNPSGSPLPSPSPGSSPASSPSVSPTSSPAASPSGSPSGATVTVPLAAGWNGVGFQRQQLTTVNASSAVAGMATWDGTAYQTNSLTPATVSAAGSRQGFFVFATGATNFTYTGTTDGQGNFLNLKNGWNLAAFVSDTPIAGANLTASVNGSTVPIGNVVLTSFSEIQPNLSYNTVNIQSGGQVRPGFAYWIFALGNVRLSWGGSTPTASPSPAAGASPTPSPNASPPARVVRASQSSTGGQTDVDSNTSVDNGAQISTDGRWGVFTSSATNLVTNDTNNATDSFIHDRLTGQTQRVSLADGGTQAPNGGNFPSVSGDGRFVAFSATGPLFTGDLSLGGAYVYDRSTGRTTRVSKATDGTLGVAGVPRISNDGRYVTFESTSTVLVPGDTNSASDVFVHDRQTGTTTRVSVGAGGVQGNNASVNGRMSADSRFVMFSSTASNLVAGDTNGLSDVFIYEMATGIVTRLNVTATGGSQPGYSATALSQDGNLVLLQSRSTSLANTSNTMVYVHNRTTGNTTLVSTFNGTVANADCDNSVFSGDGRFVVFQTTANNLGVVDNNFQTDLYMADRTGGNIVRLAGGSQSPELRDSTVASISRDGTTVIFQSSLTDLVPNDTNNRGDVFMLRLP